MKACLESFFSKKSKELRSSVYAYSKLLKKPIVNYITPFGIVAEDLFYKQHGSGSGTHIHT